MKKKRGVPIGAYTSQPLGNFILSVVDHAVKEQLRVKCYERYCDDSTMLAKTKSEAQFLLKEYNRMCVNIGLVVKSNSFAAPIEYVNDKNKRKRKRKRSKNRLSGVSVHERKNIA